MYELLQETGFYLSLSAGPYLQEAPVIIDKPDIVYMVEKQPLSITVTLNHVNASVTWKRYFAFWMHPIILEWLRICYA